MSGERLLPVGRTAARLGVGTRHVPRLVDRRVLPPPVMMAGRRMWREEDVERARLQRLEQRPLNRRYAHQGRSVARRVKQERTVLARVLLRCLEFAGPIVALDVMHRHGADHGIRGFTVEQLCRLTAELELQTHVARGVP
jgi:hypothetical protein